MLLDTPETLSGPADAVAVNPEPEAPDTSAPDTSLDCVAQGGETVSQGGDSPKVPEIDEEDRRFWAKVDVIAKITECNDNIQASEAAIEDLKSKAKEEKDLLKGEQIRLQRLASELSDIVSGKPLPENPNKPDEEEKPEASTDGSVASTEGESIEWREKKTADLLDGVKGLGKKKVDALVDAAPTAGDLEDLRGQASKQHKQFKEVLPDGFGEKIANEIENRLIEHVAKSSPAAEVQAAAERAKIEEREREKVAESTGLNVVSADDEPDGEPKEEYEDVE